MKKKTKLTPKQNTKPENDFSSLNNELGKFDLEPPKHYREETRKQAQKEEKANKKAPQNKRVVQKKKRKRSKLFKKVVSIIAMVLAIIAVIVTLSLTVFFKIDKINIDGNEKYTRSEIMDVLPIEIGRNLFVSNTDNAKHELEKRLPYIYKADIKRKFPSTIVINITETPKVYAVQNEDNTFLVLDQNLKVLENNASEKPESCVIVESVVPVNTTVGNIADFEGNKTQGDLLQMTALIEKLKLDEITAISSLDVNTNTLTYDGRITIKVGSTDDIENKVYSALTAINKLSESDPNASGTIVATNVKQIYFTEE